MITNFFIPELNNPDVQELWFQQDGATCHTARATIDLLKDTFGDRLISRFGPVNWPARSCNLTPLDYFLWGYVKKPITLVTYINEVFQEYKTVCFTDGSKLNGRVGLACVIYEEGVENVTFQHRLRDECSVFQAELLCINLVVKLIQDSLRQGGTLNFLICTDSLSSLHCLLSVNSTEKLVVELAKEATCQDMNLLMSVPLSHWKHVAWERTVSSPGTPNSWPRL
ncbi:RNase H domain-containing protein [Trichonephila clavipes]|nr:RNase H domain-containing protein [Trichonephila clavipes]